MVRLADLIVGNAAGENLDDKIAHFAKDGSLEIGGETASPDTRLGEIFVEIGVVDSSQLARVIQKQKRINQRIGELLVEEGLLHPEQLEKSLRIQLRLKEAFGRPPGSDATPPFTEELN